MFETAKITSDRPNSQLLQTKTCY